MLATSLMCHDDGKSERWLHSKPIIAESMMFLHSLKAQYCGGGGNIDVAFRTAYGFSRAEVAALI